MILAIRRIYIGFRKGEKRLVSDKTMEESEKHTCCKVTGGYRTGNRRCDLNQSTEMGGAKKTKHVELRE